MENQGDIKALVVEKDQTVVESIELVLKEKSYIVTSSSNEDEALGLLRKTPYPLAIVGDVKGTSSTFEIMRKIVMTSPMTSIILIQLRKLNLRFTKVENILMKLPIFVILIWQLLKR